MRPLLSIKLDTVLTTKWPPLVSYGSAALTVALAVLAMWYVPLLGERAVFLCFFFAVLQTALWFGPKPGLVASVLSLLAANYFFLWPGWSSAPYDTLILNAGFWLVSGLITVSTGWYRAAAMALREHEEDLLHAQALGRIGSWRVNFRRKDARWSDENYRIFGLPKGTPVTYKTFLAIVHPDDRDYVDRMWRAGLRGDPYDVEHRIVVAGQVRWVRERAEVDFARDGSPLGAFGTAQDITERKQAELERQKFVSLADNSSEFIGMCDMNFMPIYVNEAGLRLVGLDSLAQARGVPVREFFFPEDQAFVLDELFPRVPREGRASVEIRFRHFKTGAALWMIYNVFQIRDALGEPAGLATVSRDITERKQAELALAASEQRLASILESAMDAIISVDADQRIVLFNAAAERMFRCPAAEAVGTRLERFVPERHRRTHDQCISKYAQTDSRLQSMSELGAVNGLRADGEEFPVEASLSQSRMDGGTLFTAILRDVTERVQAEKVLRERLELQEQLAKIAATVPGVICAYRQRPDGSACMPYASPAFEDLYGLRRDAVADDFGPVFSRIHPDDLGRIRDSVAQSARTMAPWREAFRYQHPLKGEIWIEGHSMPLREPAGGILWHGYMQDITARQRVEAALRESEERYRSLVEQAVDGIFVSDAQGRYLNVNSAGAAMLGYTPGEILRLGIADVIAVDKAQRIALDVEEFASGVVVHSEWRFRRKDGSAFTGEVTGRQLADGRLQVIVRDISERKRIEAQLREQAEQLREADRRKDEFLAMLAHELRNPLAPLRNAAHIVRVVSPTDPKFQWASDVLGRQIAHMARLVDDLLDVSRITYGKIELQLEPLALATVLERAVETSRPLIEARQQRFEVALPESPIFITGDLVRLAQVVANLLNNAAKFTDVGGAIHLSAAREGRLAVIRVRDSGQGIAPELLPQIFDRFIQAEHTLDRAQGGLGIGLFMVKGLVEMHGGSVEALSDGLGKGSEFIVRLPAAKAAMPASAALPAAPPPAAPYRVLVVDDNVDAAESLALLLKLQGYEVALAHDGPAAIEMACALRPRVVLLDIGLPGMNGFEVAQALRARPETQGARLIAMTGYGQAEDRQRSEQAGFDHHLVKPVDHEVLATLLHALTGGEPSAAAEPIS